MVPARNNDDEEGDIKKCPLSDYFRIEPQK